MTMDQKEMRTQHRDENATLESVQDQSREDLHAVPVTGLLQQYSA